MGAVWSRVLADEATVRLYGGPVEQMDAWRSVRALANRLNADGVAHWADLPLAEAWIAEAERLASDASERAATTYAAQEALTLGLWRAIGNVYRALDLPWVVDPAARAAFVRRSSGQDTRFLCDVGEWAVRARAMGAYTSPVCGECVTVHHQVVLRLDGTVATYLARERTSNDYWTASGPVWTWDSWAWHRECRQRTGIECDCWESRLMAPLRWHYDMGREIARSLAARGPLRVVLDGARMTILLNLRNAHEAGVLATISGSAPVSSAAARLAGLSELQMAEQAAELRDEVVGRGREAAGAATGVVGAAAGLGLVAVGAAATGVGVILSGVIALWMLGLQLLPLAAQADIDAWERRRPVQERASITGGDLTHPPTHDVADPPGGVRRPLVLNGTFVPLYNGGGGGGGGARPPAGGSRAGTWLALALVAAVAGGVAWRARAVDSGDSAR